MFKFRKLYHRCRCCKLGYVLRIFGFTIVWGINDIYKGEDKEDQIVAEINRVLSEEQIND